MEEFDPDKALKAALKDSVDLSDLQAREAASLSLNRQSAKYLYGLGAVTVARESLKSLGTGRKTKKRTHQIEQALQHLAEGYMHVGELDKAIETWPHPEYLEKRDAVNNSGEWCECPAHKTGKNAQGQTIQYPTKYVKEVFLYEGKERTLYACSQCGFLNA